MPRDLSAMANDSTLQDMSALSQVADGTYSYEERMSEQDEDKMIAALSERSNQLSDLHVYTQTLSPSNIESCVVLENAAFPPEERASRQKVSSQSLCYVGGYTACGMRCLLYSSTLHFHHSQASCPLRCISGRSLCNTLIKPAMHHPSLTRARY